MKKKEKPFFVQNLSEEIKSAKSVVLVNFSGMSVGMQQKLKSQLKEVGAKLLVVKNTLLKKAGEEAKIDPQVLSNEVLSGQTALIISTGDPVIPIQILGKFAGENEVPSLKVGIIEGNFEDRESLLRISTLPGKSELLGKLLSTLVSSQYSLVSVLTANSQKLIYLLSQKVKS